MSDPPLPYSLARRLDEIDRRLRALEHPSGPLSATGIASAECSTVSTTSSYFQRVAMAVFFSQAPTLGYSVGTVCPAGSTVEWQLVCYPPSGASYALAGGSDTSDTQHTGSVPLPLGALKDYIVEFQIRRVSGAGTVGGYLYAPFTVGR